MVTVTELTLAGALGSRARATLVRPDVTNGVGVVLAHGGSDDGRRFFVDEALDLAAYGMTVALPAVRLPAHGSQSRTELAVRTAVLVQRRALDLLIEAGADPDRLGFFGHSGGAFTGAILTAEEPRLRCVVLAAYGAGALVRLAAEELEEEGCPDSLPYLRFLSRFESARFVAVPGPRRLLVQYGRDDAIVRREEAQALCAAAAPPVQCREYPCGHGVDADPAARRDRLDFFRAQLDEH